MAEQLCNGDRVLLLIGPDAHRVGVVSEIAQSEETDRIVGIVSVGLGMDWYRPQEVVRLEESQLTGQDRADLEEIATHGKA